MILLGVIGDPIAHSLSPRLVQCALSRLKIEGTMQAFRVPPERLADAVAGVRGLGLRGLSVTLPHKESIVALCDAVSPPDRTIGAVNCVVNAGGRLVGHNTDVGGFEDALHEIGVTARGARVMVLGAGGAARAVLTALVRGGASSIAVANRHAARARALAQIFPDAPVTAHGLDALGPLLQDRTLLVNTTSVGLDGASMPPVDLASLPAGAAVFDVVYAQGGTPLVRAARARKMAATDGLSMLVHQGLRALQLWTGAEFDAGSLARDVRADLERQAP